MSQLFTELRSASSTNELNSGLCKIIEQHSLIPENIDDTSTVSQPQPTICIENVRKQLNNTYGKTIKNRISLLQNNHNDDENLHSSMFKEEKPNEEYKLFHINYIIQLIDLLNKKENKQLFTNPISADSKEELHKILNSNFFKTKELKHICDMLSLLFSRKIQLCEKIMYPSEDNIISIKEYNKLDKKNKEYWKEFKSIAIHLKYISNLNQSSLESLIMGLSVTTGLNMTDLNAVFCILHLGNQCSTSIGPEERYEQKIVLKDIIKSVCSETNTIIFFLTATTAYYKFFFTCSLLLRPHHIGGYIPIQIQKLENMLIIENNYTSFLAEIIKVINPKTKKYIINKISTLRNKPIEYKQNTIIILDRLTENIVDIMTKNMLKQQSDHTNELRILLSTDAKQYETIDYEYKQEEYVQSNTSITPKNEEYATTTIDYTLELHLEESGDPLSALDDDMTDAINTTTQDEGDYKISTKNNEHEQEHLDTSKEKEETDDSIDKKKHITDGESIEISKQFILNILTIFNDKRYINDISSTCTIPYIPQQNQNKQMSISSRKIIKRKDMHLLLPFTESSQSIIYSVLRIIKQSSIFVKLTIFDIQLFNIFNR